MLIAGSSLLSSSSSRPTSLQLDLTVLFALLTTAFAGFGGILFGFDTGLISGMIAMEDWKK